MRLEINKCSHIFFILLGLLTEVSFSQSQNNKSDLSGIQGVAVVIASAQGLGVSSFGHAFLRLMYQPQSPSLDDLVVEFSADSDGENYSILKGMGLGDDLYPTQIKIISYRQMMDEKAYGENRHLYNTVLKIDKARVSKIVKAIEDSRKKGLSTYKFFTYNCASAVTQVLAEGLQVNPDRLSTIFPTSIPKILKEKDLILLEFTDQAGEVVKENILVEFQKKIKLMNIPELEFEIIKNNILSENFANRNLGYLKLSDFFSATHSNIIKSLALSLIQQERLLNQIDLSNLFRQKSTPRWTYLRRGVPLEINSRYKLIQHTIEKNSQDQLVLTIKAMATPLFCVEGLSCSSQKPVQWSLPLGDHFKLINGWLYWKDFMIGRATHQSGFMEIVDFGFHVLTSIEFVDYPNVQQATAYIMIDLKNELSTRFEKEKTMLAHDILAINNRDAGGACGSLVELQNALLTRAVFLPNSPRLLSSKDYLKLLHEVLKGRVIFIPGFSSINELTQFIPKSELVTLIRQTMDEMSIIKKGFNAEKLTAKYHIAIIKERLVMGLYTPLIVDLKETHINHALLIVAWNEKNNDFIVYDPNYGIIPIKLEIENGKIIFQSPFYQVNAIYAEFSDIRSDLALQGQLLNMNEKSIINFINETGRYWF